MENAIMGSARTDMLTLKPSREIIQAVTVVPMLAPIITETDWTKERSPALTKLTTITVVAEEDWMTVVINKPVSIPTKRLLVIADNTARNLSPAIFCRPSLISFIP